MAEFRSGQPPLVAESKRVGELNRSEVVLSRRGVLAGAVGVVGLGLAVGHHLTAANSDAHNGLYKVVYDDRQAEARAFGARFAAEGYATAAVGDDPTWLWFDDLNHGWQGAAVAGLTTPAVALSLKMMAASSGLRPLIWGRHLLGKSGPASHLLTAPNLALEAWAREARNEADWSKALNGAVKAAIAQPTDARRTLSVGSQTGRATEMVSWLLAPVSKGLR